jgi:hypothetical protein
MPPYEIKGRVEWWLYTVSHHQVLLRRPKGEDYSTRVDVLFKNVAQVELVPFFDDLRIDEDTSRDFGSRRMFRLTGRNASGYVLAGTMVWAEEDRSYNEPSSLLDIYF